MLFFRHSKRGEFLPAYSITSSAMVSKAGETARSSCFAAGHVGGGHAERIGLQLERLLAAEECFAGERIDFRDLLVGHGVAAGRRAAAVDHQERAGAAVRPIVRVTPLSTPTNKTRVT